MRRIDRYLLKEISGPLALGFLGYTLLLLIQFLFRSAEMIVVRGVPAAQVGQLLLLSLPNIVVLTIPMSLLFAILVAIGRLSAGSELTAMRASGISLLSLYRPILLLSLALTVLNTVLMLTALPWGNSRLQAQTIEILTSSVSRQVEPRVFYEGWEGVVVYVFEAPPGSDEWRGVFLADTRAGQDNELTVAESGRVRMDENGQRLVLDLQRAVAHKVDFNDPREYHINSYDSLQKVIELPQREPGARAYKSLRELTVPQLLEVLDEPNIHPARQNVAWVEIHKKFSIPVACFVFALIALPLGFQNQRGGRATGFAVSILVIMVYYVFLNNGEEAARLGTMEPWLAMWLPNLVFFAAGVFLLLRRNQDKGPILGLADRWLREYLWKAGRALARRLPRRGRRSPEARRRAPHRSGRRPPDRPATREVLVRLQRPRLRFPNTLDRYVARYFLRVFVLVAFSAMSLMIVADLTERFDLILENDVPGGVVFDFYKYSSLQIFFEMAPVIVLITTLIVFGLLSRSNEVVAAKSLGVSLYRLSAPLLLSAIGVVLACFLLEARVLPVSNQKVAELNDRIRGRTSTRNYRRADRNWLFGQGRYIYNYLRYDSRNEQLQKLQVFEFDRRHRLVRRLYSSAATYLGEAWRFDDAWVRTFEHQEGGRIEQTYQPQERPVVDRYPETPEYFESEFKPPNAMGFAQLERYIAEVKASGQAAPELEVELQNKIAYPVTCLVMAIVALPFSFRLGRKGALYGMGIGVVLGVLFLGAFAFSRTLGEIGALPPLLAVWAPSIAFSLLSLYMFLGVET